MGLTGSAPAPSFLEAVVGRPAQAPSAGERSRALELLARLIENSSAVPLKLGSSLGEQPDFVCSPDVLRYIYALRGDRNFKTGPLTVGNEKVTPLSLHCWQAIEQQGPLDVAALQPILGRDITEAAISRALQELWSGMYIFPMLGATGQPAQWELMFRRFPKPVAAGASTGHAEAQSAMISLYLQASVAAREEEILAFLSPLAAAIQTARSDSRTGFDAAARHPRHWRSRPRSAAGRSVAGDGGTAFGGNCLRHPAATSATQGEAEIAMEAEIESEAEIGADVGDGTDSGIEIEAVSQPPAGRSWRSQPLGRIGTTEEIRAEEICAPGSARSGRSVVRRFAARASGERESAATSVQRGPTHVPEAGGFSRPAGAYTPRPRSFAARSLAASAEENSRQGSSSRSGPGRSAVDARLGPCSRVSASLSRICIAGTWRSAVPSRMERKGYAAKGHGMGERAKRWEKSGEVPEGAIVRRQAVRSPIDRIQVVRIQAGRVKVSRIQAFGGNRSGSKFGGSKPWQSKSPEDQCEAASRGHGRNLTLQVETGARTGLARWKALGAQSRAGNRLDSKPRAPDPGPPNPARRIVFSRSSRRSGPREAARDERPKPWQSFRPGAGDRPAGRKPYARSLRVQVVWIYTLRVPIREAPGRLIWFGIADRRAQSRGHRRARSRG